MITAAAIQTADGKVWAVPRPGRHDRCFRAIEQGIGTTGRTEAEHQQWLNYTRGCVQGFVTDQGVFLDRAQALMHAKACGQFKADQVLIGSILTSEDLW